MSFLKNTTSNEELYDIIKTSIKNKQSLSLTRIGDGELMFLKKDVPKEIQIRFSKNWGYSEHNYLEGENFLHNMLIDALKNTDYIGLMDINNDIVKTNKINFNDWVLEEELINKLGINNKINVFDHQVTRGKIIGDINNFKNLLCGEDIHIVSCRTNELKSKNIDKLLGVNVKYTHIDISTKLSEYDNVLEKLNTISEDVILLSLGVLGKNIPHKLSKKGKVCIEFGATIDAWAGLITRPWFNKGGLQNHCLIK